MSVPPSVGTYIPKHLALCPCGKESAAFSEGPGLPAIGHACIAKVGERTRLAESIHVKEHVGSGRLFQDCNWCWPNGVSA